MSSREQPASIGKPMPHVLEIPPYPPGRPVESVAREFGIDPARIIKLASNENPNGCSAAVIAALAQHGSQTNFYPDFYCYDLQQAIARHVGLSAEQVLPAAGSSELIALVARAYLGSGRSAVWPQYSFHSYPAAAQSMGATSIAVPVRNWRPDFDALLAAVTPDTQLMYLATPNNPTGMTASLADVERLVHELPQHVVLVLDEAYREYLPPPARLDALSLLSRRRSLLIMRTFSKIYGLAGLRVGYGLADPELLQTLRRLQLPFSVTSLAQSAAIAALGDPDFAIRSQIMNSLERGRVSRALADRSVEYLPSEGNFLLIRVGNGAGVTKDLMRRGVIVRPVDNYGLDEWVRVTVGLPAQNDQFLAELDRVMDTTRKARAQS